MLRNHTSKVIVDMGMSPDGFIVAPNGDHRNALGDGRQHIHRWTYVLTNWHQWQGIAGGKTNSDTEN